MQVAKWVNSIALRFPAQLVAALGLKEGEEVELHLVGERQFQVNKKPESADLLARLRQLTPEIHTSRGSDKKHVMQHTKPAYNN